MAGYKNVPLSEVPRNIEEFIRKGWDKKIKYRIKKHDLRDICNDPEDLVQDIIVGLMRPDENGRNYIDRYNPEIRCFEVYIYVFVDNFIKKRLARENTRYGKGIVNRASLEAVLPQNSQEIEKGVVYLDALKCETKNIGEDLVELKDFIHKTYEELKEYKSFSQIEYGDGVVLQRDPFTVFSFILADYSVAEIAQILGTSKQFIYNMIKKVRETKGMSSLRHYLSN